MAKRTWKSKAMDLEAQAKVSQAIIESLRAGLYEAKTKAWWSRKLLDTLAQEVEGLLAQHGCAQCVHIPLPNDCLWCHLRAAVAAARAPTNVRPVV